MEEYEQRLHSAHSMLQACRHEAEQANAQLQVSATARQGSWNNAARSSSATQHELTS